MKTALNADEIRTLLLALEEWERQVEETQVDEAEVLRVRAKLTEMLRAATPGDGQARGDNKEARR